MITAWVNGVAADALSVQDRGLHYGDGVFETMTCVQGRVRWLDAHLERLQCGCARLQIAAPADAGLRQAATLAAAGGDCILKLLVTRGNATARGYRARGDERSNWVLLRYDWQPSPPAGLRVELGAVRLGSNPLLAGIKHLNRLEQVLAQRQLSAECDEVLLQDAAGRVVCGSMSNLFLFAGGGLRTPDLADCGVAGVMRAQVLRAAAALRVPVDVGAVSLAEVQAAPALMLTSVRLELAPVVRLAGRPLPVSPLLASLRQWILADAA